jgi:HrpA-like RNA helicase
VKIVLMSATININLFANFFKEERARVIEVPGRLYPIKLHYMPHLVNPQLRLEKKSRSERLNPEPYIQVMSMIDKKYAKEEKGDLLIFLSGLNEIQSVVDAAKEFSEKNENWIILPLHSSLSMQDQDKVFDYAPEGMRKCIVSTNIGELMNFLASEKFLISLFHSSRNFNHHRWHPLRHRLWQDEGNDVRSELQDAAAQGALD